MLLVTYVIISLWYWTLIYCQLRWKLENTGCCAFRFVSVTLFASLQSLCPDCFYSQVTVDIGLWILRLPTRECTTPTTYNVIQQAFNCMSKHILPSGNMRRSWKCPGVEYETLKDMQFNSGYNIVDWIATSAYIFPETELIWTIKIKMYRIVFLVPTSGKSEVFNMIIIIVKPSSQLTWFAYMNFYVSNQSDLE